MNIVKKINLFNETVEEIAIFDSELTRKIEAMGLNVTQTIVKINGETPKISGDAGDIAESRMKGKLAHYCAKGFPFEGKTYMPLLAGAGEARKATSTWVDADALKELGMWALCGLKTSNMSLAVNKYMAYLGLLTSASKHFAEVFGKKIDIRRVAVIKDFTIAVKAIVDLVKNDITLTEQERDCLINAFDGFALINETLTKGESCTLRGPWIKAFVQAVRWDMLAEYCKKHNLKMEFVDLWGNIVKLQDVDIILTESCFKAAKQYTSWAQYQDAFEANGHTICVCVREHSPRLKGMPYQQGQTLDGNEQDALHFANVAHGTVYKYRNPENAMSLLRGWHRAAAKLYPELLNEAHTAKCLQEKYSSKRMDMAGGRIPELGYNAFIAPDTLAFVQHLFGQKVTGYLKAGQCYCKGLKKGTVDVTRSPHLDHAHVLLENVGGMPFVPAKTPTMFINIFDMTTIRLRCDYDGDHVWYSQDEWLLDLIKRTNIKLSNLPIDWDTDKAPKVAITKSAVSGFICNLLHGSEIGIYADTLTKMWNNGYDREVCNWLTYAGNVLIDAAKHAAVKIVKPKKVQRLSSVSLPEFCRFAKATKEHPADSPYWDEKNQYTGVPRAAYTGSFLDMYSRKVREIVPEVLEIEGVGDMVFDPTVMLINPDRKVIPGLCKKGKWNEEQKTYVDAGVFQQIAFRHSAEWNDVVSKDDNVAMHRTEWENACKKQALKEMIDYCRELYKDVESMKNVSDNAIVDACYDNVVRNVFATKMTEGMRTAVMQSFWRIFGEKCVEVLKKNLDKTIPDFDSEEFAGLFADDEEEDAD